MYCNFKHEGDHDAIKTRTLAQGEMHAKVDEMMRIYKPLRMHHFRGKRSEVSSAGSRRNPRVEDDDDPPDVERKRGNAQISWQGLRQCCGTRSVSVGCWND